MLLAKKKSFKNDKGSAIKTMSLSKNMAVTGNESGKVSLWDLSEGELVRDVIDPKKEAVTALVIDNSLLFCVIAFSNCNVIVYDIELGDVAVTFTEHENPVRHLYTFPDTRVISADDFVSCKIWYAHSGQLLESITVDCRIFSLSANKKFVVSGKGDNIVKIWSLNEYKVIRRIEHSDKITVLIFSKDSNYLITGSEDNNCKIWELNTGKLIQVLIEHIAPITSIDLNTEKNLVLTGSKDRIALIWNFRDGSVSHKLMNHDDEIMQVYFVSNATTAVTGSRDGVINVWCTRFGHLLTSINLNHTLTEFKASSDGTRLIFRFEESSKFPIVSLTIKKFQSFQRCSFFNNSIPSLRSYENKNNSWVSSNSKCLPIKPNLVEIKKSKYFIKFFNSDDTNKIRKKDSTTEYHSKPETTITLSSSNNGNLSKNNKLKKSKQVDTDNNILIPIDTKPKRTRLCCMV